MKVSTKKIKRQALVFISGQMAENMKVGGIMVSNMVLEFTKIQAKAK